MAKAVRTTISIPADLKARMDAIGDPPNWSAIAARAFEQEVARAIQKQGAKDMGDVLSRLRASKRAAEGRVYQEGHEAGRRWARDHAEADALERLETFRDRCNDGGGTFEIWFDMELYGPWTHAEMLAAAVLAGVDEGVNLDIDEIRSTAEDLFPRGAPSAWLRGFVDGALGVWESVKDAI